MSFSEDVKKELCKIEPHDFWHLMSETYGLMLFSKNLASKYGSLSASKFFLFLIPLSLIFGCTKILLL